MANKRLAKYKPFILLFAFYAAWWILPATFKSFLEVSFTEFQAPIWSSTAYLDELESYWSQRSHSKVELIEAGKTLQRENARYKVMAERYQSLEEEIERLESILDLPPRREYRSEVARVIRRNQSAWWQEITLRKGKDHGILPGSGVIYKDGAVGRVTQVFAHTCKVDLITSPNFRIAAQFKGDPRPIIFQGAFQSGFLQPTGTISDAPQDIIASTQDPLKVVTNHLGQTFPAGINIGTVTWLEPDSSGIFQSGQVELKESLLSLSEVTILVPLYPTER